MAEEIALALSHGIAHNEGSGRDGWPKVAVPRNDRVTLAA